MTFPALIQKLFCAACLIVPAATAQAQSCENATTTQDMIYCQQMQLNLADSNLNRAYQDLRATQDKAGNLKLRDAQRAWIAFRDAECSRQADSARGGTMAPLLNISCLTQLTLQRVNELSRNPLTGEVN